MIQTEVIIHALAQAGVDFVIIGGIAAIAHGASYVTQDIDICYARASANYDRLVHALSPLQPSLRGAPEGILFRWDVATLRNGLNFTLSTTAGDLDLLGEVTGIGGYPQVVALAQTFELFGASVQVLGLPGLIRAKHAAGRRKDLLLIPELEELLRMQPPEDAA